MSNPPPGETKYQTLTPVPPIPPVSAIGGPGGGGLGGNYGLLGPNNAGGPIHHHHHLNHGSSHHPAAHGIYGHHPMSSFVPGGLPPGYHPSFMQQQQQQQPQHHPSNGGPPQSPSPVSSRHPIGFLSNHQDGTSKGLKLGGLTEPDSSTPESQAAVENFQVPSVSSTTVRSANGGQPGHGHGPGPPSVVPHLSMYHTDHYPPPGPPLGPVPSSPHLSQQQQSSQQQQNQSQPGLPRGDSWELNGSGKQMVAPSSMTGQTVVQVENGGEKVTKKKRKRCGECPGCLKKDNCGECGPCKSVRSHQICKMRKCDQLKTKKEKVREAAQAAAQAAAAAAAAAASGGLSSLSGSKDISGLSSVEPGTGPGSRPAPVTLNGSNGRVFVGGDQPPSSGPGVGPRAYQEYGTKTEPSGHVNHYGADVGQSGPPSFTSYHSHHMSSGSYNGHILSPGGDVRNPSSISAMEEGSSPPEPANRHQMMNHRLKSLIQSRQSSKGLNGNNSNANNNGNSSGGGTTGTTNGQSAPGYTSPGATNNFTGSNYGVAQQTVNNNSSMSPHYLNSSGIGVQSSDVGFGQLSWDSAESESGQQNTGENGGSGTPNPDVKQGGRRTPFSSSVDAHNGLNNFNNSYSHFERNNTPSNTTYSATDGGQQQQTQAPPPSNTNGNPVQYLSSFSTSNTSTTATNQSQQQQQQQQYSPLAQSPSLPQRPQSHTSAQEVPSFQTQSQSSATSPARSKSVESNATGGMDVPNSNVLSSTNPSTANSATNGPSNAPSVINNDESTDQQQQAQPFLSSTTTSMNTYTNIISTFNTGSSNAYSSSMPSSPTYLLPPPPPPPHFGFYTTGNQTVIMTSVPGTGFEAASKTFSPMTTAGVGHYMGIDCGRTLDQVDSSSSSSGFGLLDLNSYKCDPPSSSATSSFLTSESQVSSLPSSNVLPPVSLLLPSFREHSWWDRMKTSPYGLTEVDTKMDHTGLIEQSSIETMDINNTDDRMESEYRSSSSLTTLPASISN